MAVFSTVPIFVPPLTPCSSLFALGQVSLMSAIGSSLSKGKCTADFVVVYPFSSFLCFSMIGGRRSESDMCFHETEPAIRPLSYTGIPCYAFL